MRRKFIAVMIFLVYFPLLASGIDNISKNETQKAQERINSLNITLRNLYDAGMFEEALHYAKEVLRLREKIFGKEHPDVALSLNAVGKASYEMGEYEEAISSFKRALEINEKFFGGENERVGVTLTNLALAYTSSGMYADAESLYKRALEVYEKGVFEEDKNKGVAVTFNNLAILYQKTGRFSEAEQSYKKAIEIYNALAEKESIDFVVAINNLAGLYFEIEKYTEAEPLYKKALEIMKKSYKNHPFVARTMHDLGLLYYITSKYSQAYQLLEESIDINMSLLGTEHPEVARTLATMAELSHSVGADNEAESFYKKADEIWVRSLGYEHENVAINLYNMAWFYSDLKKYKDAFQFFIKSISIFDRVRENIFSVLSEKHKLTYINRSEFKVHALIAHSLLFMQSDPSALTDTFNAWLKWKGAVMEAQGRYMDALYHSDNPEIQKKFDELTDTRRELARLQLSKPEKMSFEDYRQRLEELEKKKEAIEVELSKLSKDFALEKMVGKADAKRITEILPKDSVYIDFANIDMYDFKENKFGKSRYLAFVLIPGKEPIVKLIDIADTEDVDKHIKAYLEEIKKPATYRELPREGALRKEAQKIYELAIKPLEPYIKGKKQIFISPDGNLNLIPFEVLMSSNEKYLMEDYLINYVVAGRDIIRFTDTTVAKGDALIIADPDYDLGMKEKTEIAKTMGMVTRGGGELSRDAKDLRFKRLPDTKKEADDIEKVIKTSYKIKVKNYQDKKAIEEILFKEKSPKILHLSTHGYFLKDEEVKHKERTGLMAQGIDKIPDAGIENPMLRSGIALAGVNASLKEGRDDGMVSAEKILGLKLKGTDLVVLSACETGVGDVQNGEGVFGLKRSFILSGAKTVVMSLWSVPSKETTELMTEFYTLWSQGKTKAEALREAKKNMMKKKPNPFFWGAFVMVGKPE